MIAGLCRRVGTILPRPAQTYARNTRRPIVNNCVRYVQIMGQAAVDTVA